MTVKIIFFIKKINIVSVFDCTQKTIQNSNLCVTQEGGRGERGLNSTERISAGHPVCIMESLYLRTRTQMTV